MSSQEDFSFTYESEFEERLISLLENYFGDGEIVDIADAGFSGTDHPLVVQCEICNACIHDFDEADNLIVLHRMISDDCPFVKNVKLKENYLQDVDLKELLDRCKLCCVRCKNNPVHCWPEPVSVENVELPPAEAAFQDCPTLVHGRPQPGELAERAVLHSLAPLAEEFH
jgi:Inhibitor of Apoptosis domain